MPTTLPPVLAGIMDNFQRSVADWMRTCFSDRTRTNRKERAHRLLEESLELFQASGCSASEADALLNYVFSREPGDVAAEVGDVLLTVAALASANDLALEDCASAVLVRAWDPRTVEKVRAKRAGRIVPGDYAGEPEPEAKKVCPSCGGDLPCFHCSNGWIA